MPDALLPRVTTNNNITAMILPIYTYGLPVLRKVAEDITPDYPELHQLIENMQDTLVRADGVGLAAPQIGLPIRLVIIDLRPLAEDMPEFADFRKTYINAHVIDTDGEEEQMEEGCLSLPGIHEKVSRPTKVHVQYLDEQFVAHDEWVEGYLARVMQHEFDHLEGHMFIDHLSPLRRQMNKSKLNALIAGKVRADYKIKSLKK